MFDASDVGFAVVVLSPCTDTIGVGMTVCLERRVEGREGRERVRDESCIYFLSISD